ncbi:MAG: secondary thiamine-phosphate synthase enzyme YjbQ [Chloroflexota bacterium]|nr:secondary thiamine-phosphate synthase enzyme YjbQ [Chloroflexota bacterium]
MTRQARDVRVCIVGFTLQTDQPQEFIDITTHVENAVAEAGVTAGTASIFSRHTTAAIVINEAEPGLLRDMERMLERLAPEGPEYEHNAMARTIPDEPENGHAHTRHLLLGASETVPIHEGRLYLGTWQRVFLVELDGPRPREVVVQVIGVEAQP